MKAEVRNQIEKMVQDARRLLEQEIHDQLEGVYGLHRDGNFEDVSSLPKIKDNSDALKERKGFEYFISNEVSQGTKKKDAVNKLVLGLSFTHFNRLIALKLMERRKVIRESISRKTDSNGFKFFLADYPEQMVLWTSGKNDEVYKNFLLYQYRLISEEIHVLFDPEDVSNLIFPKPRTLYDLLDLINQESLADVWEEDETIGWIYQYFTPKELIKKARSESPAPRNSYELAFRNQFYTPRYVVRFLTDNTLGRMWYEMHRGDTKLTEICEYMVRRPNEIFLEKGEETPEIEENSDKTQEELLKELFYIPYRAKKDPREIKTLDPATGSGHFLLYCFDILQIIYEEAYEDPDLSSPLREDYPSIEEYRKAIPGLILRHNLHGIDIDLRATQITSLALWLRAQKAYQEMGLKAQERPKITKSNIVCAEPMPGNEAVLKEFKKNIQPAVLGDFVTDVWDEMKLAGEAGSLLKIEETITNSVKEAKEAWLTRPKEVQIDLFGNKKFVEQMRFNLRGIKDQMFWEEAEELLIDSLKKFAEAASNGDSYPRKLFAENAAHGFAFIDVISKKYDIVLMNPPFGAASEISDHYIGNRYNEWQGNLACAFIILALEKTVQNGLCGAVVDRSILMRNSYEKFRLKYLLDNLSLMGQAELGWNVLDANVEVSSVLIRKPIEQKPSKAFGIDVTKSNNKDIDLKENISNPLFMHISKFKEVPFSTINFQFPRYLLKALDIYPTIKDHVGAFYNGHTIKSDVFKRLIWELNPSEYPKKWKRMWNGSEYSPFYVPMQEAVIWKEHAGGVENHPSTIFRNTKKDQLAGLCYGKRGDFLDVQILPKGHVLTNEGFGGPFNTSEKTWYLLGYLNSLPVQYALNSYCGQHKGVGYVNSLPIPPFGDSDTTEISKRAKNLWEIIRNAHMSMETDPHFHSLFSLLSEFYDKNSRSSFQELIKLFEYTENSVILEIEEIDKIAIRILKLSDLEKHALVDSSSSRPKISIFAWSNGNISLKERKTYFVNAMLSYFVGCIFGRWDVRLVLNNIHSPRPPDHFDSLPTCPPGMLVGTDGLPAKEGQIVSEEWLRARESVLDIPENIPRSTISDNEYPLKIDWDGILVDDPGHIDDISRRVKDVFELFWRDKVQEIENEACEILRVKSLKEYFSGMFFDSHIKMYSKSRRKAPIYWQLSSKNKNYSLWIYYHRLTSDTIFLTLQKYINPKVEYEETRLLEMKQKLETEKESLPMIQITKREKEIEKKADFVVELKEFKDTMEKITHSGYDPNFDDGVILNMSALHEVIPWKEPTKYWKELEAGNYDWAHIAMKYWPERVKEKGKKDKSPTIAHGTEELYDGNSD